MPNINKLEELDFYNIPFTFLQNDNMFEQTKQNARNELHNNDDMICKREAITEQ